MNKIGIDPPQDWPIPDPLPPTAEEDLSWKTLAMDMKEVLQLYKQRIAELEAELESYKRI